MFTADLLERAAKTALQAFIVAFAGSLTAAATPGVQFSIAWWQAMALAALAAGATAAVSAVTSLLSKPLGNKNTASILPTVTAPAAPAYPATLPAPLAPEDHASV